MKEYWGECEKSVGLWGGVRGKRAFGVGGGVGGLGEEPPEVGRGERGGLGWVRVGGWVGLHFFFWGVLG